MHNIIKSKTCKLLILIAFSFTLTGCWIFNDDAEAKTSSEGVITVNGKEKKVLVEAGSEKSVDELGRNEVTIFGRIVYVTKDGTRIVLATNVWQGLSFAYDIDPESSLKSAGIGALKKFQEELDSKTSEAALRHIDSALLNYAANQDDVDLLILIERLRADFLNDVVAGQATGTAAPSSEDL